jgi:adenylate kinase
LKNKARITKLILKNNYKNMNLILVGPQGSGKGTHGKLLAEKYNFKIFETGAVVRAISKESSPLGKKIKTIAERGDLIPNEIIMEMVNDFLDKIPENQDIILDGIPRSLEQKESLDKVLQAKNRDYKVVFLSLTEDLSIARLLSRAEKEGRADDNLASIKNRLKNFNTYTTPLLDIWKEEGGLVSVDGGTSIENGFKAIEKNLNLS